MFGAIAALAKGETDKKKAAAQGMQQQQMGAAQGQASGMMSKMMSSDYTKVPSYQDFTQFK